MSQTQEADDCVDRREVVPQHHISSCPTCRLIRVRDTSRATTARRLSEAYGHGVENGEQLSSPVAESDSESDSEPFEFDFEKHPTYSYRATLDFFHGAQSTRSDEPATLCSLCDHWINGLLIREWGESEVIARVCLGTFSEIESRSDCPGCHGLCQIISKHSFRPDDTKVLALELFKNRIIRTCKYRAMGAIVYKDVGGVRNQIFDSSKLIDHGFPRFEVLEKADVSPMLAQQSVNWERLFHLRNDLPNVTKEGLPNGFCLINIGEACLVEIDSANPPPYAALSYVWGKSEDEITTTMNTFTKFQRPGRFLEADVPLLFRDSFKVCSQLGVDYLWIDRICIIQDDSSKKSIQLEAMGQIYSMASFTIVSREPASVRQGLHGVSQSRIPQFSIPLGDMLLVPSGGRISMLDSTWFTRGWTYQEGALSRKLLIFGEDMVYTACRDQDNFGTEGFRASETRKAGSLCISPDTSHERYAEQVSEYSQRNLTYNSDIVNAFLGVLGSFGQHIYGLPLTIFDQAILWYPGDRQGTPRLPVTGQELPSWSWISMIGKTGYHHHSSEWNPLYSVATWAVLASDASSNDYVVELLDALSPTKHPEAAKHMGTIPGRLMPLEARTRKDPVSFAMVVHICEQYRRVEEKLAHEQTASGERDHIQPESGAFRKSKVLSFLRKMKEWFRINDKPNKPNNYYSEILSNLGKMKKRLSKEPWFGDFEMCIRQIPHDVRLEMLLRIAKPPLPNLVRQFSQSDLEAASKPGRIVVHAPKIIGMLRYDRELVGGPHLWKIGYGGRLIGVAELSDYGHQELVALKSQSASQDVVEVHCIALSMMVVRARYTPEGRGFTSVDSDLQPMVFVMVVTPPANGCSHRLGLGHVDFSNWPLRKAMVETTILE
ncbi:hypothetical protein GQX73_g4645 [Xylaria multiplex]|uniref:Heterokaryon incompatibility domain-containing protein n=1 Tax=Xylaria multiplex TaxID=323545 RepID=A0A7C8ISS2_9PEZI|nr:hypothetical protein GQX73_g4645 [Xylaria multiplex]